MLELTAVSKRFGEILAVDHLDIDIRDGELLTLLGPSGCGKTTTLRMIAGFEAPTSGTVTLRGEDITRATPQARGFGMVFQNYALFPHLSVGENVAFGLKVRRQTRAEVAHRTAAALDLVDLAGYEKRRVQQLSGGQQQRVALARALAPEPPLLLLDEPLSNLDATLRERTRAELRALLERLGMTAVFVTHDQEEAFALSDRIAVMRDGALQQVDTPEALYGRPANAFVASFLGRANFLAARVVSAEAGDPASAVVCELAGGVRWSAVAASEAGFAPAAGDRVRLMIRPELVRLRPLAEGDSPPPEALQGEVIGRRYAGDRTHYAVRTGGAEVSAVAADGLHAPGDRVSIEAAHGAEIRCFPAGAGEDEPAPGPADD